MSCGMPCCVWILVEVSYFFFVDGYGQNFLFFEFIWVVLVAFDYEEAFVFVETYFGRHEEYLGEEILLLEYLLIVRLFQLCAFIHWIEINYKKEADKS